MNDNVTKLPIKVPDQELANEHRKKILDALNVVCKIIEDANKDGFEVGFGIQKGPIGNQFINQLTLAKHF